VFQKKPQKNLVFQCFKLIGTPGLKIRGFFKGYTGVFLSSQPKVKYSKKMILIKEVGFIKFEQRGVIYHKKSPYSRWNHRW